MLYGSNIKTKISFSKAFTVIEVGVIIPIVLLVIGAFILTIINFTTQAVESRKDNVIAVDTQNALNRIASDVSDSLKFLAANDFTPVSPQGSSNNTTKFTNLTNRLILQSPLTKANPRTAPSDSDNFVYKANSPLACSSADISNNAFATYNIVYFAQGNQISRRVMVPSGWTGLSYSCGGVVWQKPTCLAGRTGTYCSGGADENISRDYKMTIALTYYEQAIPIPQTETNSTTEATRQQALDRATSVKVSLTASKTIDEELQTYKAETMIPLN